MGARFEWFNPSLGAPIVSVAEYGLTFNRAATEMLGKPDKIMLGFDKDNRLIAVKPLSKDDADAKSYGIAFARKERDGYVRIASKDFIRFILRYCPELKLDKTVRCLARWDDTEGLMLVDVKNPLDAPADEE